MKKKIVDYYRMYLYEQIDLAQAYAEAVRQKQDVLCSFEDYVQENMLYQRVDNIVDLLESCIVSSFMLDNGYYLDRTLGWIAHDAETKETKEHDTEFCKSDGNCLDCPYDDCPVHPHWDNLPF